MREKLFCEECNKELDFVYVHGYDFGDRVMEGVRFKVRITGAEPDCFGVDDDSEAYMIQFNWEHWKKRCEEYCENADIAQCPECRDDVIIEDDETAASRPEPVVVKVSSAADVLKGLK
jgi:hypothetical protein